VNVGQNGSYVFVVENGKAVMRGVQVLYQDEHIAALRGAVRAGETVVTDGQLRLTPGARVDIVRGRR
jgi:multidrug efflux system membrane fusion protein